MSQGITKSDSTFPELNDIAAKLSRLRDVDQPRYRRLWASCRNPMRIVGRGDSDQDRPYRQAQEWGLPTRLTGAACGADVLSAEPVGGVARKEIVIENDIGWRVEALIDYLFGRPIVLQSSASDPKRREIISELLREIIAANGGILFLQQLALLGTVYGFVDVLVKFCDEDEPTKDATINTTPLQTTACGVQELGQPPAGQKRGPDAVGASEGGAEGEGGASGDGGPAPDEKERAMEGNAPDQSDDPQTRAASDYSQRAALERLARMVRLEIVEPARALPFLSATDYRVVVAYGQVHEVRASGSGTDSETASGKRRWFDLFRRVSPIASLRSDRRDENVVVEMITETAWRRYENGRIAREGVNSLGRVPLVHIQNTAVPFSYSGVSDVEPLIPLQDELNTRLSDRANRITLQSFRMYLGKNIDGFDSAPVSPGRMWVSDDKDASVQEFGGDASCPSEDAHLADIREAIDKTSGVTPIAAGAIKGRIGRLTSAAALRVTLQALLAKTEKKRTTYGTAIGQICDLALAWLDRAGLFPTDPRERRVEINWPSPIPENELEKLTEAEVKARLGVPKEIVLRELGY